MDRAAHLSLQLLQLSLQRCQTPVVLKEESQFLFGIGKQDVIHKGNGGNSAFNVQNNGLWGILRRAFVPLCRPLLTCSTDFQLLLARSTPD